MSEKINIEWGKCRKYRKADHIQFMNSRSKPFISRKILRINWYIVSTYEFDSSRGAGAEVGVGMLRGRGIPLLENKKVSKFQVV